MCVNSCPIIIKEDLHPLGKVNWFWLPHRLLPDMVAAAMKQVGSTDPLQVATALEGMRFEGPTGAVWMRPEDHQLLMPLYETAFTRAGQAGVRYDAEDTGFGWKSEGKLDPLNAPSP